MYVFVLAQILRYHIEYFTLYSVLYCAVYSILYIQYGTYTGTSHCLYKEKEAPILHTYRFVFTNN